LYAFGRVFQIAATPASDTTPGTPLHYDSGQKGTVLALRQKTRGLSGQKGPVLALRRVDDRGVRYDEVVDGYEKKWV